MDGNGLFGTAQIGGSLISTTAESLSADKYSIAVIRAREVAALNKTYKANPSPELKDRLVSRTDRLLGFLLTQFRPDVSPREVRPMVESKETVNSLSEDELVDLPENLIPVAIVRDLLFKHRIYIDSRLPNWETFANRYAAQIV